MFQPKQIARLTVVALAISFFVGCGKTVIVQPTPQVQPQQEIQPPAVQSPTDGQVEVVRREPDPKPAWVNSLDLESNQQYLAFKGRSRNTAQAVDAEEQAYRNAQVRIGNYLFTHVNERMKELLKNSGVSSEIYDPQITAETVREVSTDAFVRGGYPTQAYTEYLRRYERGRWVYYYQVQMLVKYPQDEVAVASQDATRRALKRLKAKATDGAERQKIQQSTNLLEQAPPPQLPTPTSSNPNGSIWALLVGINQYENFGITPLHFAAQDARLFAQALSEATPPQQVWLMTHDMEYDEKPTHTNVLFQLGKMIEQVGPQDTLLLFFSGHSISKDGKHYLLSVDSDPRSVETLEASSVSLEKLRQLLSQCQARQVALFLDGCRNDPEAGKGDVPNLLTEGFVKDAKQLVVEPLNSVEPQNYAVLFACSVGERAYEDEKLQQGVFSYYLVRGFRGEAVDATGKVTVTNLANYLQRQVSAWSQKYSPSGKKQTPWLHIEGQPPMVLR